MAIVEKVRQIIGSSSNKDLLNPSIKLVENIESSQVLEVLKDISSQLPEIKISENVIEDGRKMVVTVDWEKSENNANNYFIVSITEPAISFIGNKIGRASCRERV